MGVTGDFQAKCRNYCNIIIISLKLLEMIPVRTIHCVSLMCHSTKQVSTQNAVVQFGSLLNQQHKSAHIWHSIRVGPRVFRHENTRETLSMKHQVCKFERYTSSLLQTCSCAFDSGPFMRKLNGEPQQENPNAWWKKK